MNFITENLDYRFTVLTKLTTDPHYTNKLAAAELGISVRQIIRIKKVFDNTIYSLEHKNRNNTHALKFPKELIEKLVALVKSWNQVLLGKNYDPMNYKHAFNRALKFLNINMSYSSFVRIMHANDILSSRSFACELGDNLMHLPSSIEKYCGEEWQGDGTFKFRLGANPEEHCFHLIVDAASNVMIAGYIDFEETTNGYLNAIKQGFEEYGRPFGFATDKRGSFYNSKGSEDRLTTITQIFSDLDISIRVTSNPRSKNKVESKNAIVKDWIMKELALRNIETVEEANELMPEILKEVNKALGNFISSNNVHRPMPENYNYEQNFSRVEVRKLSRNNTIAYQGEQYVLVHDGVDVLKRRPKTEIKLHINYNGEVFHMYNGRKYNLVIATKEQINGLDIESHLKKTRVLGAYSQVFSFKKQKYHLVDEFGVCPKFSERQEMTIYYSEFRQQLTLKLAKVDGKAYKIKEGYPKVTEDEYEYKLSYTKNSLVNYGGINYELHNMNCECICLEKDDQILLEIKNSVPIIGTLRKHKYILIPHHGL